MRLSRAREQRASSKSRGKRRPEKKVLVVVLTGDRSLAGAFNTNIFKAAANFMSENGDKQIDIDTIGRKGRDLFRRRYPAAQFSETHEEGQRANRQRGSAIEVFGGPAGALDKINYDTIRELTDEIRRVARQVMEAVG